jgi:hypothetical protein
MSDRVLTQPGRGTIGTRYIDGGVRSPDNADLAWGYANVMVLSPLGGRSRTPPERGADPAGQFEGLRRPPEWGHGPATAPTPCPPSIGRGWPTL